MAALIAATLLFTDVDLIMYTLVYIMVPPSNRIVHVRGNMVSIYAPRARKQVLLNRLAVSSDWLRLWFLIHDNGWDEALWNRLGDKERLYMVRAARLTGVESNKLEIAHAEDQRREMDRLATLEGEVQAGNISKSLATEYNQIVDQLGYTYDLDPRYIGHLKNRMANSLKKEATI